MDSDADTGAGVPLLEELDDQAWLTARQAATRLGVERATVYSYVSKGQIESIPDGSSNRRLYRAADVERVRLRAGARSGHAAVAGGALRWGDPVLDTSISTIRDGVLTYRSIDVRDLLSGQASFEKTAELLWTGEVLSGHVEWTGGGAAPGVVGDPTQPELMRLMIATPQLAAADPVRVGAAAPAELDRARDLLRAWTRLCRGCEPGTTIADSLCPDHPDAARTALILCADHELNASAFAARVVASTGADLYACVQAGLAALSGPKHGGMTARVAALIEEADGDPIRAERVVTARLARGEEVPGFGHPLYPDGDPRTPPLLAAAFGIDRDEPRLQTLFEIVAAMEQAGHPPPSLDVGLMAVAYALGRGAAFAQALFAIGRCAGWIAHVLEQRRSPALIRPRARYVGDR